MSDKRERNQSCQSKTKRKSFLKQKQYLGLRDSAHILKLDIVEFWVRWKKGAFPGVDHFQSEGINYWNEADLKKLPIQLKPKKRKEVSIKDKINEIRRNK